MKTHQIMVVPKEGKDGQLLTGGNVLVTLDGAPIKGLCGFAFQVQARGMAKVTLELYADVLIKGDVSEDAVQRVTVPSGEYEIGNLAPRGVTRGGGAVEEQAPDEGTTDDEE